MMMMRTLLLAALLAGSSAGVAQPGAERPDAQASAGPLVDCLRGVGRELRARRAPVGEFVAAVNARCEAQAAMIRASHPNVLRLSLDEARSTYAYCLRPETDESPRCRSLR